jgi:hypothetical protein
MSLISIFKGLSKNCCIAHPNYTFPVTNNSNMVSMRTPHLEYFHRRRRIQGNCPHGASEALWLLTKRAPLFDDGGSQKAWHRDASNFTFLPR